MKYLRATCNAVLFLAGLALVGSDGVWFPWINLLGMVLLVWLAISLRERSESA